MDQDGRISLQLRRDPSWSQRIASLLRLLAVSGLTVLRFRGLCRLGADGPGRVFSLAANALGVICDGVAFFTWPAKAAQ